MLFAVPKLTRDLRRQLLELDRLRNQLGDGSRVPTPWLGRLRRRIQASSAESSISIEGFRVPEGTGEKIIAGEEPPGTDDESRRALDCYARAMYHVGVMAVDPSFRWTERVILDLHFDACWFQRDHSPGLWRTGPVGITAPAGEGLAYEGPSGDRVPALMEEVVEWLEHGDLDAHVVVRAAIAHLHIVSVHPFRDGNGRLARIIQSLVLAREGLLTPELGSIEEYLGHHTAEYYAALMDTQGGRYQPQRDTTGWVELCVHAHIEQAQRRLAQLAEAGQRWGQLEEIAKRRGWPDRLVIALEQSLFRGTTRLSYAAEADISPATASADLRRLLDSGLIVKHGRGRITSYVASEELRSSASSNISSFPL
jgi:Fic family protein